MWVYVFTTLATVYHLYFISNALQMIVCQMKPNKWYQFQIDGNQWLQKIVFVPVPAHKYQKSSKINKSMLHRPPSHLLKRQCCWSQRKVQGEETKAVSAWPTQEFTKFRFSSSSLGDDLNVTRVRYPSSCFMKFWRLFALKVPCTSCFLGQ